MRLKLSSMLVSAVCIASFAAPEVKFSGYLDADAWLDFKGNFYTNNELDLGMSVDFTEKVSAHVYATVRAGLIPAGLGLPKDRWADFVFDGFDITYKSKVGTFSVGDLVYQYGKFNYYFYKRLSMITNESFTRGIKYENGNDVITQGLSVGIADVSDDVSGDIVGSTSLTFGENQSLGLHYGIRGNARLSFKTGTDFFAGAEYNGSFGENVSIKADVGYLNVKGAERKNVFSFLLEPSLSFGSFSTAFTGFFMLDPDSANDLSAPLLTGIADEMFFYVEPGYSFNDYLGIGLPLEIHAGKLKDKDDNNFWAVPTFYVYPTEGVQWWIWGQMVVPMVRGITKDNLSYALGSEIIVTF